MWFVGTHANSIIVLGENISLILTVDPLNIKNIPDVKFLGPAKLSENFRTTVNDNLEHWDKNNDILIEILRLIGMYGNSFSLSSLSYFFHFIFLAYAR